MTVFSKTEYLGDFLTPFRDSKKEVRLRQLPRVAWGSSQRQRRELQAFMGIASQLGSLPPARDARVEVWFTRK